MLAWGFVYLVFGIVTSLLTRPMMEEMILAKPGPGMAAAPPTMPPGFWPVILIANLGSCGMLLVLLAAATRAVLKPEEQGAFFIRVGLDELRLLGTLALLLLIGFALYVAINLVMVIAMGAILFVGLTGSALEANGGGPTAIAALVVALLFLAVMAAMIAFQTRFALALPLTLQRERIVMWEAWRRSKGHFWGLFGGFLLGGLIVSAVAFLLFLPMLFAMLSGDGGLAGAADPARQVALMRSPWLYPVWLLTPLIGGFFTAMTGGSLGQALLETEAAG